MSNHIDRRRLITAGLGGAAGVYALSEIGEPTTMIAAADVDRSEFEALVARVAWLEQFHDPIPTTTTQPPEIIHRVFSGDVTIPEGFEVPVDELWVFDPTVSTTVTVSANVVVRGRFRMRPASADVIHTLRFAGINETLVVGGMAMEPLTTDVGLWVQPTGQVEFVGTPKVGWNRTGDDPTWAATDELRVAPHLPGIWNVYPTWAKGDVPPEGVPGLRTEVFNLTRNVRIEGGGQNPEDTIPTTDGRAHVIFNGCTLPQTVRFAQLRYMGQRKIHPTAGDRTLKHVGRYGLHFHMCGESQRGNVIEGVVIRDSGNHAFVPHLSHGMTFRDCVTHNTKEAAFWWDLGRENQTNDITWDRCLATLVLSYYWKATNDAAGFYLGISSGSVLTDSCVSGVRSFSQASSGIQWPEPANGLPNVWRVERCVVHNTGQNAFGSWQNNITGKPPHNDIRDLDAYNVSCFKADGFGILHGAYVNEFHYEDVRLHNSKLSLQALGAAGPTTFTRVSCEQMIVAGHRTAGPGFILTDVTTTNGILVHETTQSTVATTPIRFVSTAPEFDLDPADFTVERQVSIILVENHTAPSFTLQPTA